MMLLVVYLYKCLKINTFNNIKRKTNKIKSNRYNYFRTYHLLSYQIRLYQNIMYQRLTYQLMLYQMMLYQMLSYQMLSYQKMMYHYWICMLTNRCNINRGKRVLTIRLFNKFRMKSISNNVNSKRRF